MQTLALQIDSRGVGAVLAETASGDPRPVAAFITPLAADPAAVAEALRSAAPTLRGGKLQLAVALPPSEARLRRLAAPPAPDEELPHLVKLQAAREAAADADGIIVDFVPPSRPAEGPLELLVAWAPSATIDFWRQVAAKLGGRLALATPRSLAACGLAAQERNTVVVVTRAGDEVDIVATRGGEPVAARSARLMGDNPAASARRELRRTLLSLPTEGGEPTVYSDWDGDSLSEAAPGEGLDPQQAAALQQNRAAWGMVLSCARGDAVINLADPRRPPEKRGSRRTTALLAAAAGSVLLFGGWMAYERLAALDREIAELQTELNDQELYAEDFQPQREQAAALDRWLESDVTWLDELERLSVKLRPEPLDSDDFPVATDVRLTQLIATSSGDGAPGGRMQLRALARTASTSDLEARLRDSSRPVEPISTAEADAEDAYRYEYSAVVRTPPASESESAEAPSPEPTAASSPAPDAESDAEEAAQ
ncbi:hypothetical protein [Botrimarina sp.]|uniref:hypothetical protein n=1 Tax=Botrimarina sp. TaxID=2795802 RepID=UPI0032F03380